jgi:hypothetical protein
MTQGDLWKTLFDHNSFSVLFKEGRKIIATRDTNQAAIHDDISPV